jgi:hypothetical protein
MSIEREFFKKKLLSLDFDMGYLMAKSSLENHADNILLKNNLGWAYFDVLKYCIEENSIIDFNLHLQSLVNLNLHIGDNLLLDQLCWQSGKMIFAHSKLPYYKTDPVEELFILIKNIPFRKSCEASSFLFKSLFKVFKKLPLFISVADWFDFSNFIESDFLPTRLPKGNQIISIVEQAYIAYAKLLLPSSFPNGSVYFNKKNALDFIPKIYQLSVSYPKFHYLTYYHAKLLRAIDNKEEMLVSLIPFVRKKRNEFWAWEILAEALENKRDLFFSCYCKALTCDDSVERTLNLRQKMVKLLISLKLFNEAKSEMQIIIGIRNSKALRIPDEISEFLLEEWYNNSIFINNESFYKQNSISAEDFLYSDIPEENIIVDFVNSEKKILHFIATDQKIGTFKYNRFLEKVKIGDCLRVRFENMLSDGYYRILTCKIIEDKVLRSDYIKEIQGLVKLEKLNDAISHGFIEDAFIFKSTINKYNLKDGDKIIVNVMRCFIKSKNEWGLKVISIQN